MEDICIKCNKCGHLFYIEKDEWEEYGLGEGDRSCCNTENLKCDGTYEVFEED